MLEIEHGTIDGKTCAHAYDVVINEKSARATGVCERDCDAIARAFAYPGFRQDDPRQ